MPNRQSKLHLGNVSSQYLLAVCLVQYSFSQMRGSTTNFQQSLTLQLFYSHDQLIC